MTTTFEEKKNIKGVSSGGFSAFLGGSHLTLGSDTTSSGGMKQRSKDKMRTFCGQDRHVKYPSELDDYDQSPAPCRGVVTRPFRNYHSKHTISCFLGFGG
jgi:hypothetical protein